MVENSLMEFFSIENEQAVSDNSDWFKGHQMYAVILMRIST
jgi:hypothetical protein